MGRSDSVEEGEGMRGPQGVSRLKFITYMSEAVKGYKNKVIQNLKTSTSSQKQRENVGSR